KSFFATCASRLRWTRKSSTSPSLSTARHSQYLPPRIEITISSRCQWSRGRGREDRRPELQEHTPDRLVGCVNTSLGQQFLDIPKGQGEPGIEPDRVADDFWREAVALKRYRSHPMMLVGDQPQSYPSY